MEIDKLKQGARLNKNIEKVQEIKDNISKSHMVRIVTEQGKDDYYINLDKMCLLYGNYLYNNIDDIEGLNSAIFELTNKFKSNLVKILEMKINELKSEFLTL